MIAARKGDGAAFDALVRRYRPAMLLIAQGECSSRDCAEDAVQDALLVAKRSLKGLDEPSRFGPWIATIVRHRARRLTKDGRRLTPLSEIEIVAPPLTPPSPAEEAIDALPEGVRESIFLYYLQRWSVGEIAALLERPVTTVKWQLHVGRALLRKRLGAPENL